MPDQVRGSTSPQKGIPLSCQYSLRNPKDVWQHPSLAPAVQKLYLSHPGFEPKTCPLRERAANQLSQSEVDYSCWVLQSVRGTTCDYIPHILSFAITPWKVYCWSPKRNSASQNKCVSSPELTFTWQICRHKYFWQHSDQKMVIFVYHYLTELPEENFITTTMLIVLTIRIFVLTFVIKSGDN